MLQRFKGEEGRRRLVDLLATLELVLQNRVLAEKLAEVAKLKAYKKGQEVYIEGQPGKNKLYFILSGAVDLVIKESFIRVIECGQAVGEFPIIDPSLPYTVTIRACEACIMATVLEQQSVSIGEQYPEIWKNMAKMLVARLHATRQLVPAPKSPCVFIGHGRSELWVRVQRFLQNECGLKVNSFESEPRAGESIVSVLEDMLGSATFAVLVLTGEDETAEGGMRARQNVVHEAGLFQGVLGFQRAILLVQKGSRRNVERRRPSAYYF